MSEQPEVVKGEEPKVVDGEEPKVMNGEQLKVEDGKQPEVDNGSVEKSSTGVSVKVNEWLRERKALLMPKIMSLKDQVITFVEMAEHGLDVQDISNIITEVEVLKRMFKGVADQFIAAANETLRKREEKDTGKPPFQFIASVQSVRALQQQDVKDLCAILQNALGSSAVEFYPFSNNHRRLAINFANEEIMSKALKIIRNKPLGINLRVVETRRLEVYVPPRKVSDSKDNEFDISFMLNESLLRCRELTQEEYNRMLEWKDKFVRHHLLKMCDNLDFKIGPKVEDCTDPYFFKLVKIRSTFLSATDPETYQTYSGVNPDTGSVEMGYWRPGGSVPSRIPRTACIQKVLKVLTDFMESSGKPFYDLRFQKGYWDSVMIRSNHVQEIMVLLVVHTSHLEPRKDCDVFKPLLVEQFQSGDGKDCGVKSIYMKFIIDVEDDPDASGGRRPNTLQGVTMWTHIYGDIYLDDKVAGLNVDITKDTIMEDSSCTKQLFETIVEELNLQVPNKSGVLGVGISAGLICIYVAKHCNFVVGWDKSQKPLKGLTTENVKLKKLNNLKNVFFEQESLDKILISKMASFRNCEDVYAVLSEIPNSICDKDILGIRRCEWIKKIAILMDINDISNTVKMLCDIPNNAFEPFIVTKVIPFDIASTDMQPNMLFVFERITVLQGKAIGSVPNMLTQQGGPPIKRLKMNTDEPRPRQLVPIHPEFCGIGPPPMPFNRGNWGPDFNPMQPRIPEYGPQREPMEVWLQGRELENSMHYEHPFYPLRSVGPMAAEEEAMWRERAWQQKEAERLQMQENELEAQRRRLKEAELAQLQQEEELRLHRQRQKEVELQQIREDEIEIQRRRQKEAELQQIRKDELDVQRRLQLVESFVPSAHATPNIEEVVLSVIKKVGLLDKGSTPSESAVPKSSLDFESMRRKDFMSSNYSQESSADDRPSLKFQDRDLPDSYQDRDVSGLHQVRDWDMSDSYQHRNRDMPGRHRNRDVSGSYQDSDQNLSGSYRDREISAGIQDRDSYPDRGSSGHHNRDVGREDSRYSSKNNYYVTSSYGSQYGNRR